MSKVSKKAPQALDLSGLLELSGTNPWKEKLEALTARIPERAVLTRRDVEDHAQLMEALEALERDAALTARDRWQAAERRISAYLAAGVPAAETDPAWLASRALEYEALCALAGETPTETLPEAVEEAITALTRRLEKQREDAYVMETLTALMEELGCHVQSQAVLDEAEGRIFSLEGHPLCQVFVGQDQSGMLFEPVAAGKDRVSLDQRRQIQDGARHVCGLYEELEARALARGVVLRKVYQFPADWESIRSLEETEGTPARRRERRSGARIGREAEE